MNTSVPAWFWKGSGVPVTVPSGTRFSPIGNAALLVWFLVIGRVAVQSKNLPLSPLQFLLAEMQVLNVATAPIWVAGLIAFGVWHRFADLRLFASSRNGDATYELEFDIDAGRVASISAGTQHTIETFGECA